MSVSGSMSVIGRASVSVFQNERKHMNECVYFYFSHIFSSGSLNILVFVTKSYDESECESERECGRKCEYEHDWKSSVSVPQNKQEHMNECVYFCFSHIFFFWFIKYYGFYDESECESESECKQKLERERECISEWVRTQELICVFLFCSHCYLCFMRYYGFFMAKFYS